jgi:hypothetical protein
MCPIPRGNCALRITGLFAQQRHSVAQRPERNAKEPRIEHGYSRMRSQGPASMDVAGRVGPARCRARRSIGNAAELRVGWPGRVRSGGRVATLLSSYEFSYTARCKQLFPDAPVSWTSTCIGIRMAQPLVADATRPPFRDGRATRESGCHPKTPRRSRCAICCKRVTLRQ